MRKLMMLVIAVLSLSMIGCGFVEENHVGVRTSFTGAVEEQEIPQGFYTAFTSSVDIYTTKEMMVEVFNMTPKAADNLSLADFDLEVYFVVNPNQVAEKKVKYANRDAWANGVGYSLFHLVKSMARETSYDVVS